MSFLSVEAKNLAGSRASACDPHHRQDSNPTPSSLVDRLANGYFSRHPVRAMVLLAIGFGLAGGVAPCAEWLLSGGL